MRRNWRAVLVVACVISAGPAAAQVPTQAVPTGMTIYVLPPGTSNPDTTPPIAGGTRSVAISATSANCNQVPLPIPPPPLVNPLQWEMADPFQPVSSGRRCRGLMPTGLPNGTNYRTVATFTHATAPESGRSALGVPPFDLSGAVVPHAAPTDLGVRP